MKNAHKSVDMWIVSNSIRGEERKWKKFVESSKVNIDSLNQRWCFFFRTRKKSMQFRHTCSAVEESKLNVVHNLLIFTLLHFSYAVPHFRAMLGRYKSKNNGMVSFFPSHFHSQSPLFTTKSSTICRLYKLSVDLKWNASGNALLVFFYCYCCSILLLFERIFISFRQKSTDLRGREKNKKYEEKYSKEKFCV